VAGQRLQVELIGGLRRHELHGRPLHRFGDRFRMFQCFDCDQLFSRRTR
jgi:hypothetical protein